MSEVNNGFCLGFEKWLDYNVVIMGSQALGFSLQCCHFSVFVLAFMLALECLSAGA